MNFPASFSIAGREIGPGAPCLVIAEAGVNHFGSMEKAFRLVDMAVEAGADVLKIQHFHTDRLIGNSAADWRDRMRSKELSEVDVRRIKEYCDQSGILFLCTPHDDWALRFLNEDIGLPAFKIGSGEVENWPFLAQVAQCGKPVILSTGMYRLGQIREAIQVLAENGCPALSILHCVTSYPAPPEAINLKVMDEIRAFFPGPVGYSDHTAGTAVPLAAVARGANVLEKHITLDRDVPNAQDWKVSCDPSNFATFVAQVREIEAALGSTEKNLGELEQNALLWARKSLHAAKPIPAGCAIDPTMLVAQRPGKGISPAHLTAIAGHTAKSDIPAGAMIDWDMIA
ncbi:MAG: N-acetylneuraminate synthase family protein [Gallionellaceae bacterium]|nr:N-acetylneuraminate synthase family protein [Gallionellaceae bacterium]